MAILRDRKHNNKQGYGLGVTRHNPKNAATPRSTWWVDGRDVCVSLQYCFVNELHVSFGMALLKNVQDNFLKSTCRKT